MKLMYTDENNAQQPVVMGSYGIGLERAIASAVEASHDDRGIIWPTSIAPYQLHLISIDKNKKADAVYEKLISKDVEVFYDDREGTSAGEKFADADLIGIPYRATVSKKTAGKIELKKRTDNETNLITTAELIKFLK